MNALLRTAQRCCCRCLRMRGTCFRQHAVARKDVLREEKKELVLLQQSPVARRSSSGRSRKGAQHGEKSAGKRTSARGWTCGAGRSKRARKQGRPLSTTCAARCQMMTLIDERAVANACWHRGVMRNPFLGIFLETYRLTNDAPPVAFGCRLTIMIVIGPVDRGQNSSLPRLVSSPLTPQQSHTHSAASPQLPAESATTAIIYCWSRSQRDCL